MGPQLWSTGGQLHVVGDMSCMRVFICDGSSGYTGVSVHIPTCAYAPHMKYWGRDSMHRLSQRRGARLLAVTR